MTKGLGVAETAHAIVEIANAAMVSALRLVSVQCGFDPRDFTLIALGGAGPLHANRLAAETEMAATLIPASELLTRHASNLFQLRSDVVFVARWTDTVAKHHGGACRDVCLDLLPVV